MHRSRHPVRLAFPWLLTIATLLVIPGCAGKTPIKTLLDDPGLNNGKQVQIAGEVTKSPAMPSSDSFEVASNAMRSVPPVMFVT
jgi:hypothetical protein